jgi:hypothetical protein
MRSEVVYQMQNFDTFQMLNSIYIKMKAENLFFFIHDFSFT